MRLYVLIFLFCSLGMNSQDKVFFRVGTVRTLQVISVTNDRVFVKDSEGSAPYSIPRSELLLIDQASGRRFIFATTKNSGENKTSKVSAERRQAVGVQPFEAFWGRATFVYEHIFLNGKVGVALPLSITYNPVRNPGYEVVDSVWASSLKKVGFITGLDLNFYVGKKTSPKFFIGPRFRYGTDILLQNIEGFTFQSQLGWRFGKEKSRICQHLALGFGFARVLATSLGPFPESKQAFGWYSATYRFSFRW